MQWLHNNLWNTKGQKIGTITGSISGVISGAVTGVAITSAIPIPILPQVVGMSMGGKFTK